jgi:anti-sigma regulatory factor (Ser/Thr protein kinase)
MTALARPDDSVVFTVDRPSLGRLRAAIADWARRCGINGTTAQDLVLIANELATNVVRHGGGLGRMWLWCDDGAATCQVSDWGGGMPEPDRAGTVKVDQDSVTGRGLWLVRRMSQRMHIKSGPAGTTVTVTLARAT